MQLSGSACSFFSIQMSGHAWYSDAKYTNFNNADSLSVKHSRFNCFYCPQFWDLDTLYCFWKLFSFRHQGSPGRNAAHQAGTWWHRGHQARTRCILYISAFAEHFDCRTIVRSAIVHHRAIVPFEHHLPSGLQNTILTIRLNIRRCRAIEPFLEPSGVGILLAWLDLSATSSTRHILKIRYPN